VPPFGTNLPRSHLTAQAPYFLEGHVRHIHGRLVRWRAPTLQCQAYRREISVTARAVARRQAADRWRDRDPEQEGAGPVRLAVIGDYAAEGLSGVVAGGGGQPGRLPASHEVTAAAPRDAKRSWTSASARSRLELWRERPRVLTHHLVDKV
jgi:hypothetical protein